MRRPSRNCPTIICAQAPSRPEGRAQRGRSEAQRLARCRAQMQHRCRDGRRVDATPEVFTSRRPQVDIEYDARQLDFPGEQLAGKHPRTRPVCGNIFRTNRTGSSGISESQSSPFDAENNRRFSPPNRLCSTPCSDRDSHGVSDPSGQARGHIGRAQRGRSRHGLLPLLRHRRRHRAAKSAARSETLRAPRDEVSEHEGNAGRRPARRLRRSPAETRRASP
jgi:hypothetical protein